jgi:chromosome segregation ATPase
MSGDVEMELETSSQQRRTSELERLLGLKNKDIEEMNLVIKRKNQQIEKATNDWKESNFAEPQKQYLQSLERQQQSLMEQLGHLETQLQGLRDDRDKLRDDRARLEHLNTQFSSLQVTTSLWTKIEDRNLKQEKIGPEMKYLDVVGLDLACG